MRPLCLKTIKFIVTKNDIYIAHYRTNILKLSRHCNCPIALSVRRRFPKTAVRVSHIYGVTLDRTPVFELSEDAQEFMETFDNGKPVEPIELELELV